MKGKVFLVQWDSAAAQVRAEELRRRGFRVEVESENGGRAYRSIRTHAPDVVVIDLGSRPSHGREVGGALRDLRATGAIPILCVEEGHEARERTREKVPDAVFVSAKDLCATLEAVWDELGGPRPSSRRLSEPPRSSRRRPLPIEDGLERG